MGRADIAAPLQTGIHFEAVGLRPDSYHTRQFRLLLADIGLEPKIDGAPQAAKVVDHGPTRVVAVIVDAADIDQIIERQFLFRESADLGNPFSGSCLNRNLT